MKILLFGKDGQIGQELQRSLVPLGTVTTLGRRGAEGLCGDLTNGIGIARTIEKLVPDVIINAAAYTAVDKAEKEKEAAFQINATAPEQMAYLAARLGAWLVHYSTDYVFNGTGTMPWREEDEPAPLNVYGASKLAGEKALQVSGCKHLIFRTSWIYAAHGQNFVKTIIRLAREREGLRIVSDQIGSPTGAAMVADITAKALEKAVMQPSLSGLYHLTASGETSWCDYARFVLSEVEKRGFDFKTRANAIEPIATRDYKTPAQRPLNSRLDTGKLRQAFGIAPEEWKTGVRGVLEQMIAAKII